MIADRLPPLELRRALDGAVRGVGLNALRAAADRVSAAYRGCAPRGPRPADAGRDGREAIDRLAYAAVRMPATLRAASAVLRELRIRCPALRVEDLLDIGSGPATCLWAVWSEREELQRATLIEPDPDMVALGRRLLQGSRLAAQVDAVWRTGEAGHLAPAPAPAHDLVMAGYLLGELDAARRRQVVDAGWAASRGAFAIIEPGSAAGFVRILAARERLLALGARVVAPCPHAAACPLPPDDWCHFAARLNRTALQRGLKRGMLAYEDEKYAYVLAVRGAGAPAPARVVRRPRLAPGRVVLRLCGTDGLRDETVERTRRTDYRAARKTRWGDAWAPAEQDGRA